MATEIKMPKMGIDMVEGAITRWLKNEGDTVKKEEPIAEVETDKSTVEMTSPADGVLLRIIVKEDQLVPVGEVLAYVGEAGEEVAGGAAPAPEATAETKEEAVPGQSETPAGGDSQAAAGEAGEAHDEPPEEAAEPAADGQRAAPSAAVTDDLKVSPVARRMAEEEGVDLSKIKGTGPGGRIRQEDVEAVIARMADEFTPPDGVRASPAARRIAREKGYSIADIPGTGPDGRIVVKDVNAFQPSAKPAAAPAAEPAAASAAATARAPSVTAVGEAEEVPLSRMRKRITEVLTASKAPVPHFYVTMDVDMEAAMALRSEMNAALAEEGIKISVNDLVVKATALALKKFPNLNSSFAGDKIVRHGDINVGVAVSTEAGLLTIATRSTDRLALSELSQMTRERAGRAREGKVQQDDLGGTTFTVSNLGMYGVDSFVAIITPPEAGILAIGGIREEPVVKDGQIVAGQRMRATLSADHRVTDGAEGAEFMVEFKRLLENPMRLML